MNKFNKILIANRGEIAVRTMKAAHELDIETVAVYSEADMDSLHIQYADEAWCIGEESLADTYLNIAKIIDVAIESNCDAIHPGYGFLAENPDLVQACEENDLVFIGPSTRAIQLMGNKIEARAFVDDLGVPMTKAITGSTEDLLKHAKSIELPILVKAAAGGGGKGMRIVRNYDDLEETIISTSREAKSYFGDGEVFIEKYIENPRHIEIQVLGDTHGNIIHLYERECSIQRRYQKIIEESPSPSLNNEVREKMGQTALDISKAINYHSAGTMEFLVDSEMNYYFLEMNTRIQVEHPVTEMVTGVDIVKEQILIAAGEKLSYQQSDIKQKGHAIEARVYAEDPSNDFRPAPGMISYYQEPYGEGIRVDAGIDHAVEIKSFFDPMIAKLIVWDEDRNSAIEKTLGALEDFVVLGIETNISYMHQLLRHPNYIKNQISTKFCDEFTEELNFAIEEEKKFINKDLLAAAYFAHTHNKTFAKSSVWDRIGYWRLNMDFKLIIDEEELNYTMFDKQKHSFNLSNNFNQYAVNIESIDEHESIIEIADEETSVVLAENHLGNIELWYNALKFSLNDPGVLQEQDFYESSHQGASSDIITSPMPGKVIKVLCTKGDAVKKGDQLLIVEAMKMENNLLAPRDGEIEELNVQEGEMVDNSKVLLKLKDIVEL